MPSRVMFQMTHPKIYIEIRSLPDEDTLALLDTIESGAMYVRVNLDKKDMSKTVPTLINMENVAYVEIDDAVE